MKILFVKKQIIFAFISIFISTISLGQATFSGGGSGTESDPYVIKTTDDWNAFASSVTSGTDYKGLYVQLHNDITVGSSQAPASPSSMVGTYTTGLFETVKAFKGTFDGNWKTLEVYYVGAEQYAAPFVIVDGATIKNLTVSGRIATLKGSQHAGGIVSCVGTASTTVPTYITNCTSSVTIVSDNPSNNGQHGGLVGWQFNGALNFENCIYEGSMTGNTNNCAGFVGVIESSSKAVSVSYKNCTQAHAQIANSPTTFGTFHLPSDIAASTPAGQTSVWETAYFTRRIGDDRQGTLAYCDSKPIPPDYNKILRYYERGYGDKAFYVPAAVVDLNTTDIYTNPVKPTVTYYGKELVYDTDFTTKLEKVGNTYNAIVRAKSSNYYGSETISGINVADISTWSDLQALLGNSTKARHITLGQDYVADESDGALIVKGTVYLDLNKHTIDRGLFSLPDDYHPYTNIDNYAERGVSFGYVMKIESGATVTIKGEGTIKGGCNKGDGGGINNVGSLTLEKVTLTENFCIRAAQTGPQYGTGTGVYSAARTTLAIYDCIITENVGDGGGGGINMQGSTLIMKDTYITENRVNSKAGGVRLNVDGEAIIKDCFIENNVVKNQGVYDQDQSDGGGIYLQNGDNITLENCIIKNNSCAWRGGGIQIQTGQMTVKNSVIKRNSALGENPGSQNTETGGGGIHLSGGSVKLIDCIVEENSSYTVGGVFCKSNNLKIEGNTVIDNNIGDATKANVYLANSSGKITVTGPLAATAKIGVSRDQKGYVTSGLDGKDWAVEDNFRSDNYKLYWLVKDNKKDVMLNSSLSWKAGSGQQGWNENFNIDENGNQFIGAPIIIESGQIARIERPIKYGRKGFLFVEDGGQLIYRKDPSAKVAVIKNITGVSGKDAKDDVYGWYTISAPVGDVELGGEHPDVNLVTAVSAPYNFDLLRYNEAESMWETYVAHPTDFRVMESGRGYLYRNAHDISVQYVGGTQVGDVAIELSYSSTVLGGKLKGWNLIGNPYTFNIYKGGRDCAIVNGDLLGDGFYRLTNSGAWGALLDDGTAIKPGEGILVKALKTGELTIHRTDAAPSSKANSEYIEFTVSNNSYEDVAYALFKEEGEGLPKINHRNPDVQMLYINREGENYAIATMSDDVKTFGLNFSAKTTGQYTLSCDKVGDFSYLHVIDRLTGQDTDMLLEGKYSFIGSPKDSDARFIVRLSYKGGSGESGTFAYQSGNDVVVCGEGELQVYDALGRKVMTRCVNGVETINLGATGVYILRLTGAETMTQKMVVR